MATYCVDPVCKCTVEEDKTGFSSEHEGKKIYFCSVECKEKFEKDPFMYMAESLRTGA